MEAYDICDHRLVLSLTRAFFLLVVIDSVIYILSVGQMVILFFEFSSRNFPPLLLQFVSESGHI